MSRGRRVLTDICGFGAAVGWQDLLERWDLMMLRAVEAPVCTQGVQPEDHIVIHYVVMDSLAHLQKLIDKYCGSRAIFRQIIKIESLKAFLGQQFNGWTRSSHEQ